MLDAWEGEGSGWTIDRVPDIYINVNDYDPLAGSSYLLLPAKLSNPKQGLINIKNKDIKCLMWCHVRLLNPTNNNPQRIKMVDRKIAEQLDYSGIEFPVKEKHYPIFEQRFSINLKVFYYNERVYPIYISEQHNERVLNLKLYYRRNIK